MRVYVSGPITHDPNYMSHFMGAVKHLSNDGYDSVINPALVNGMLPTDLSHEEYMVVSLAQLQICDTIYMLNGWRDSKGAIIEYGYAKKHGYNIIYESEVG